MPEDNLAQYREEWMLVVSQLIARAWADPEFQQALLADPHPHLHAAGLMFPDRYDVEFYVDHDAEPGTWHSVGRAGRAVHRFAITAPPDVPDTALGMDMSGLACCCPCASCTGAAGPETWSADPGASPGRPARNGRNPGRTLPSLPIPS